MKQNASFCIVGLGLMGGSYAIGLTGAGHRVTAVDTDPDALAYALENGLIVAGADARDEAAVAALVAGADYLVLAIYPKDILAWLAAYAPHLKPGALVTDLCGVKSCFIHEAQALLAQTGHEFIGSHPMAGRETSGVQNATDAMFRTANFVVVPTEKNTPEGIAFAEALAQTLGFARVTTLGPEEHDAMIGYVSQLTHAIAVSLMVANDDERLPAVTGDSFRDLTRIADINDELWSELFLANAPALTAEIDAFTATLAELRGCVQNGDKAGLQALMQKSRLRRRDFAKK